MIFLITGISLLIVFHVKKIRKKKKVSIILIAIGIILLFPIAYIFASNSFHKIKHEYSIRDTGAIVEIDGYNTKEFEFNGNKYLRLNDYLDNVKELSLTTDTDKKAIANVHIIESNITKSKSILSTVTSFFFPEEKDIYKLYLLDDNQDKNLLYSEFGGIWCSTQYLNQAVLYYDNIDNYQCFFVNTLNSDKTKVSIDNDTYNKILFVIENYYNENKENIKS